MARFPSVTALAIVLFLTGACSDDNDKRPGPHVVTISDLVGTWSATALSFENPANDEVVDMGALGYAMSLAVEEGGRYALTIRLLGQVLEVETGVFAIEGDVLIADPDEGGEEVLFSFSLEGDTLEIMNPADDYDFDGDGTEDPAISRITLVRDGADSRSS